MDYDNEEYDSLTPSDGYCNRLALVSERCMVGEEGWGVGEENYCFLTRE